MINQPLPFPLILCSTVLLMTLQRTADSRPAAAISIDVSHSLGAVGSLCNVGYNGWGDQLQAATEIARETVAHLAREG